jgi:hypothetical protein
VGCVDFPSRHSGVRNRTTNATLPTPRGCVNLPYNTESDRHEWTNRIKKVLARSGSLSLACNQRRRVQYLTPLVQGTVHFWIQCTSASTTRRHVDLQPDYIRIDSTLSSPFDSDLFGQSQLAPPPQAAHMSYAASRSSKRDCAGLRWTASSFSPRIPQSVGT